jgi:hypothetical protein
MDAAASRRQAVLLRHLQPAEPLLQRAPTAAKVRCETRRGVARPAGD